MRIRFETQSEPLASNRRFVRRMVRAGLAWSLMALGGLAIGMAGYMATEGLGVIDAFLNASMILSGMGQVNEIKTDAGKIFAGLYAMFSGLLVVIASGFVLAPIAHRVLHAFHVEEGRTRDE